MKTATIVTVVFVLAALSTATWALGPENTTPMGVDQPSHRLDKTAAFEPSVVKARDLIGMRVENPAGDHLGKIEDIVLRADRNQVAYAVLTFGGVLGLGEKYFAVPWAALQTKEGARGLTLEKTREQLRSAPGFDKNNWPNMANADWTRKVNEFYGQKPAAAETEREAAVAPSPQMQDRRVSKLFGLTVHDAQDKRLGDIRDIAIDTHLGHLVYGIIALATPVPTTGADMAAVPWTSLSIEPTNRIATLDVSKSLLDSVAFRKSEYPNLADREFTRHTYEAFNRQPYWDVYGYTAPGIETRKHMGMREELGAGWAAGSEWNKRFNPANVTRIRGTIEALGSFEPAIGAKPGVQATVKTDDGKTITVQLGPRSYLSEQKLVLATGDRVEIKGCSATIYGQSVFLASEIAKGSETLELRDAKGVPTWRAGRGFMMDRSTMEPAY